MNKKLSFIKNIKFFSTKLLSNSSKENVIPSHQPPSEKEIKNLNDFIINSKNLIIFTGAGISTESGLRDYRSSKTGLYTRMKKPMLTYEEFINNKLSRQKYWLRNFLMWSQISLATPNSAHKIFAFWEKKGLSNYLITQNIDRLHQKAGSKKVLELHGSLYEVKCISCQLKISRITFQRQMMKLNSHWLEEFKPSHWLASDNDITLSDNIISQFKVPSCEICNQPMKSDVIFFGEDVPPWTLSAAATMVTDSDAILVAGSSLHVHSCYQFLIQGKEQNKKIAIINIGRTRADHLSDIKINSKCGEILSKIII